MPYNDFVRNVLAGSVPTTLPVPMAPVPGAGAPVTFTPMPGTQVQPAMQQAQQAVAMNDQQVQAIQEYNQQRSAAAQRAQAQAKQEEEQRHRGGGFFGPLRRAANAIADYPETISAIYQNIRSHPLSMGAWGSGALMAASPAAAVLGVPLDYMKMYAGEGLYRAAKGDYGYLMAMGGPAAVAAGKLFNEMTSGGTSSIAQGIIWAHDQGYNNWKGGNAVWEIMTYFETEHLPDPLKYSIRALNDIAFDPLTWTGAGAAAERAGAIGRASQIAARGAEDVGSASFANRAITRMFPHGTSPLQLIDRTTQAANMPFDAAISTPFKLGGKVAGKANFDFFRPPEYRQAAIEARAARQPVLDIERTVRENTILGEGPQPIGQPQPGSIDITNAANLPEGFTGQLAVAQSGDRLITLTDTNTKQAYTISINETRATPKDGGGMRQVIRVSTPLNPDGQVVPTIEDAFTAVMQTQRQIDLGAPSKEQIGRRDVRQIANGGFEIAAPNRGSVYATPDEQGRWTVYDEDGTVISEAKSESVARRIANQVLDQRPLRTQTLGTEPIVPPSTPQPTDVMGDLHVGPAFGADVTKNRPMDVVAREHAGTAKGTFYNKTVGELLQGPKKTIENEEDWVNRMKPVVRGDMTPEQAAQYNRPGRVIDTPAKVMAQLKGTLIGQRHFRDIFGDRDTPWPRLWKEDQASIIKTPGTDVELKYQINHRDAAYQAVMDPSDANAKLIIDYFKKRAKLAIPKDRLTEVLIEPGMANRFARSKTNVNYGRILEANREAFLTGRGHIRAELPPYVLEDLTVAGALPASTGPMRDAMAIGSAEDKMIFTQPGQRFLRNPEDAARLGEDTGKRYAGPIEATPEGVQATYQTGANKGKPVKGSILESSDQPSIGDTPIYTLQDGGPATGFTTSKGSTYTVGEGGRTIRDKAARPEHPGQVGIQPESHQTVYMTAEDMAKWDILQTEGGMKRYNPVVRGNEAALENLTGKNRGKFVGGSKVSVKLEPEVGLHPVEIWRGDNPFVHFGNDITDVTRTGGRQVADEPIRMMLGNETTPLAQPRPKAGPTLQQQLEASTDDPVAHRKAADNFVNEVVTGTAVRTDPGKSGYRSYVLKNTETNEPNTSIHIGENNTIVVTTTLASDDPVIRNIVARAGDDAKIRVQYGLPDLVGEPMGLSTAKTATTDDHFGDLVYRGWMLKKFTDEERANLERVITVPGLKGQSARNMRVADAYLVLRARHGGDGRAAFKELGDLLRDEFLPKAEGDAKKKVPTLFGQVGRELLAKWDAFINHQRDVLMFNWATGPVSAVLDHMGDTARAASMGHVRAALEMQNPRSMVAGYQEAKGDLDALMNASEGGKWYQKILPAPRSGQRLKAIGRGEVPELNLGVGREEAHREGSTTFERWMRNYMGRESAKNFRRVFSTVLLDGSGFVQHMRSAGDVHRRFILYVDAMMRALPDEKVKLVRQAKALQGKYKNFDVIAFDRELGDAFNPDDVKIVAMRFGLPDGQAETLSRAWTNQLGELEKTGVKRLNEVFFSYEGTKADDVLKRIFLFHYWYTRASVAYTRTILKNPYLYVNYMRAMEGLQHNSEDQPSAVKGMIQALATPGGFAIFMDPFKFFSTAVSFRNEAYNNGEGGLFDAYLAQAGLFLNPALQAAASMMGWAANNNPDPFATFQMRRIFGGAINWGNAEMGGGMLGAPFQEGMNQWVENVSGVMQHFAPFSHKRYANDPKANDKILVRTRTLELVEQDLGIAPGTDFSEWTPEQLQTLETALDAVDSGDDNPYADAAYKDWAKANFTRNTLSMALPFGFSTRSQARDNQLTQARRIPDPTDPENSFLPVGAEGFKSENDIASAASGDATSLAISDAQFDSLFPANEAGRMMTGPHGETQDEVMGQPQNALFAQYREWKKGVGDYRTFRQNMERVSPAYQNYMNELRGMEPYKSDENALDNAGVGYAAYVVLQGGKPKQFSRNPAETLDPTALDPSALMGGGQTTPSYSGPTNFEDLGNQIQAQLMGYYQDQVAFDRIATQMFGAPIQMDMISPIGQRLVRSRMAQMGVRIPELGGAAAAYQAWARSQVQGTPTNIADYLDYLRLRYGAFPSAIDPNSMQAQMFAS